MQAKPGCGADSTKGGPGTDTASAAPNIAPHYRPTKPSGVDSSSTNKYGLARGVAAPGIHTASDTPIAAGTNRSTNLGGAHPTNRDKDGLVLTVAVSGTVTTSDLRTPASQTQPSGGKRPRRRKKRSKTEALHSVASKTAVPPVSEDVGPGSAQCHTPEIGDSEVCTRLFLLNCRSHLQSVV